MIFILVQPTVSWKAGTDAWYDDANGGGGGGSGLLAQNVLVNITCLAMRDRDKNGGGEPLTAVPALFGPVFDRMRRVSVVTLEEQTGCTPFTVDLRPAAELDGSDTDGIYILLPRGGCPFDTKVRHAQDAGFNGVLVHNVASASKPDVPVRMQTATGKPLKDIRIPSLFLTGADGRRLREAMHPISVPKVRAVDITGTPLTISPNRKPGSGHRASRPPTAPHNGEQWQVVDPDQGWDTFREGVWGDALVSAVCLVLGALGAMAVGASLVLLHNRMFEALGIEYAQRNYEPSNAVRPPSRNLARVVIATDGEMMIERIRLPLRVLTQNDIDRAEVRYSPSKLEADHPNTKPGTDCCAICIDEFTVGGRVRELPCRHCFHDTCIDPWLLYHALICPVCKRDVIPQPTTGASDTPQQTMFAAPVRRISSISIVVGDQSPPARPVHTRMTYAMAFAALGHQIQQAVMGGNGDEEGDEEDLER
ncbi:E3 ubiquitin-protein ligase rnf13 [Geranomyces variabilis]|nr:E3 ubiquitin-protein ligase rnf13 [Geranomyces variabilis]